jgi:hypothetical protein
MAAKKVHGNTKSFSKRDLEKIKWMKVAGNTNALIARVMGVSVPTLEAHCKELLQNCNSDVNGQVCMNLFNQTKLNPAAAIFWMKCRAGWSTVFTAVDPDSGESIKIQLVKGSKPAEVDTDLE